MLFTSFTSLGFLLQKKLANFDFKFSCTSLTQCTPTEEKKLKYIAAEVCIILSWTFKKIVPSFQHRLWGYIWNITLRKKK